MLTLKRWPTLIAFILPFLIGALLFFQPSVSAQATGGAETGGAMTGGAMTGGEQTGGASAEGEGEAGTEAAAAGENPYAGDEAAIAEGQALFVGALGCYGCHGREGGGGMGPNISDNNWIYGGDDASIFTSIHDGRPNGMPAFAAAADEDQIWKVVAFVQSLSQ